MTGGYTSESVKRLGINKGKAESDVKTKSEAKAKAKEKLLCFKTK